MNLSQRRLCDVMMIELNYSCRACGPNIIVIVYIYMYVAYMHKTISEMYSNCNKFYHINGPLAESH